MEGAPKVKIEVTITPQIKITANITPSKKKSPAPKKPKAQSISQKTDIIINHK